MTHVTPIDEHWLITCASVTSFPLSRLRLIWINSPENDPCSPRSHAQLRCPAHGVPFASCHARNSAERRGNLCAADSKGSPCARSNGVARPRARKTACQPWASYRSDRHGDRRHGPVRSRIARRRRRQHPSDGRSGAASGRGVPDRVPRHTVRGRAASWCSFRDRADKATQLAERHSRAPRHCRADASRIDGLLDDLERRARRGDPHDRKRHHHVGAGRIGSRDRRRRAWSDAAHYCARIRRAHDRRRQRRTVAIAKRQRDTWRRFVDARAVACRRGRARRSRKGRTADRNGAAGRPRLG